jgi:propanol-preferring alcohol dehydrogenase
MSPFVPGLRLNGQLIVARITADPITLRTTDSVLQTRSVIGVLTGSAIDNEDSLAFARRQEIRSMNEVVPLSEAPRAYERMMAGEARFRMVLTRPSDRGSAPPSAHSAGSVRSRRPTMPVPPS